MFPRGLGGPGEVTQESAQMSGEVKQESAQESEATQNGGWMTDEMRVHLGILQTGTINEVGRHRFGEKDVPELEERGFVNDVATQCRLLGGPLGSNPVEGGDSSGHKTQRKCPEIPGRALATPDAFASSLILYFNGVDRTRLTGRLEDVCKLNHVKV